MMKITFPLGALKAIALVFCLGLAATQHFAYSNHIHAPEYDFDLSSYRANHAVGIVVATGGAGRIAAGFDVLNAPAATRMLISGTGAGVDKADIVDLITGGKNPAPLAPLESSEITRLIECCVDLGPEATNTKGNALEAKRWAEIHNFHHLVVVTSDYHLPRAMMIFERQMPDRHLIPHAVPTPWLTPDEWGRLDWWQSLRRVGIIGSEMIKFYLSRLNLI